MAFAPLPAHLRYLALADLVGMESMGCRCRAHRRPPRKRGPLSALAAPAGGEIACEVGQHGHAG
jgi:hypothetical protein